MEICEVQVVEKCTGRRLDRLSEKALTKRNIVGYRAGGGRSHEAALGFQNSDIVDGSVCI
jgi:hypothetical protein